MKGIKPWWWAVLAVVIGLSIWSSRLQSGDDALLASPARQAEAGKPPQPASTVAVATNTTQPAQAPATNSNDPWHSALHREVPEANVADPFRSSKPAEAAEPAPVDGSPIGNSGITIAPPPPLSPPFRYLGKLERNGRLDIYLDYHGSPLIAHIGDKLNEGWQLDQFNAGQLSFTHLASGEKHTVAPQP
ncbi:hypothetical protein [Chitinimonas sp.]|uniref:hypothetical protein n=1 Tax=Chitinimonas sp. TaxID=1934313 RepID=UPI0035B17278